MMDPDWGGLDLTDWEAEVKKARAEGYAAAVRDVADYVAKTYPNSEVARAVAARFKEQP